MKYYFYKNPFFKVYAEVEAGRVRMKTAGLAAPLLKPMVSEMLDIFDDTKPSKIEDDRLIFSTWMPPIPSTAFDRLVASQIHAIRGKMVPEQVTISVTEECPNKCIHCALPDTKNKLNLAPIMVKDVIDQSIGMGTTLIIFDGGEPLVYDGLEDPTHCNEALVVQALVEHPLIGPEVEIGLGPVVKDKDLPVPVGVECP